LGWAHSYVKGADGKPGERTQLEAAHANGGNVPMPPLRCPYLYEWLTQAGPAQAGGMGLAPLGAAELSAWSARTCTDLAAWEFSALQRASRAYCAETSAPGDWPPWGDPDALYDDDVVADKLAESLRRLCQ